MQQTGTLPGSWCLRPLPLPGLPAVWQPPSHADAVAWQTGAHILTVVWQGAFELCLPPARILAGTGVVPHRQDRSSVEAHPAGVDKVVDHQGSQGGQGKACVHAGKAHGRNKEAKDIGAKTYA